MPVLTRRALVTEALAVSTVAILPNPAFSAASSSGTTTATFVETIQNGFKTNGAPFAVKGDNYAGSWREPHLTGIGHGMVANTLWSFFQEWRPQAIEQDLVFLRTQLGATAIRVALPAEQDFTKLVRYHRYQPWFKPDGSVSDLYAERLLELCSIAARQRIRIQFCLTWAVGLEIYKKPEDFRPGQVYDRFYARQVRSVAQLFASEPQVIGYSIGNEMLLRWELNGKQRSWYEPRAAGFILRRIRDLRSVAPRQLVTTDTTASPWAHWWHSPAPEFAVIPDVDESNQGREFRLVDYVDYVGAHYYPIRWQLSDNDASILRKLNVAESGLIALVETASEAGKPLVLNEFGLSHRFNGQLPSRYSQIRDQLYQRVLAVGQRDGLAGLLAWRALPQLLLRPGTYKVRPSPIPRAGRVEVDLNYPAKQPSEFLYDPSFSLFRWETTGEEPVPTAAARALAAAWSNWHR